MKTKMECWNKMMAPMRKVWTKLSKRLRLRKSGIVKLQQDVQTCEYEDVHILWDMLKRNETDLTGRRRRRGKGPLWDQFVEWAKRPLVCHGG